MFTFSSSFAQKTLEYYINEAIKNSPLLKDYQNQVLSNNQDSLRLRASYGPQVIGSTYNTYSPLIAGWGYDNAISNGGNFNTQVMVNKALIQKNNFANELENISLQSGSLKVASRISQQDLKRTITVQYITIYGDFLQIKFNDEVLVLLKSEEQILKKLTESSVYKQTDFLTFFVSLQQQELLIKRLKIQFLNDVGTLKYLCGLPLSKVQSEENELNDIPKPTLTLHQLPEIKSTFFYQQFVFDSLKIKNSDRQIDFNYKIRANVFADLGFVSSLSYQPYKNWGTSFGFSANVPIYDGNQRKMQHTKNKIVEMTRQNYRDFFLNQYQQQRAQLYQQIKLYQEIGVQMNDQLKYSERLIEANNKLLKTGDVRMTDYLMAINNFLNAKNQISIIEINGLQLINQVNYWNN